MKTAQKAFKHFSHGLETGEWQPYLDMLTDDFTLWFPLGKFRGKNVGKDSASAFFKYLSEELEVAVTISSIINVCSNENTVVFEFVDEGTSLGKPYQNRMTASLDVRGDKICGHREYVGDIDPKAISMLES